MTVTPRRWQLEALAAWVNARRRGVVEVVTGGGKTIFAHLCIAEVQRMDDSSCIVIVVPTQALLDQWYVGLREDLAIADTDIALWSAQGTPSEPRRFNLMVI